MRTVAKLQPRSLNSTAGNVVPTMAASPATGHRRQAEDVSPPTACRTAGLPIRRLLPPPSRRRLCLLRQLRSAGIVFGDLEAVDGGTGHQASLTPGDDDEGLLQCRTRHLPVGPEVRRHGRDPGTRLEALVFLERVQGFLGVEEVGLGEGLGADLVAEGATDDVVVADRGTVLTHRTGAVLAADHEPGLGDVR